MKKRILFVIESLSGGGAEKVLSVIVKYFNYEKYNVTVCPIVDTGVYCDEIKKYANHYSPVISYHGNFISRFWNRVKYKLIYSILPLKLVYKWFLPQNSDVEIAFCEGYVTKLLAQANSKSRKIAWIHTDLENNPWPTEIGVYKNIEEERKSYAVFEKIVCVSQFVLQSFIKLYGMNDKTIAIYNPIDVNDIRQNGGEKVYRNDNVICIISVGRLVPQKGYDRLLSVVKRLHDEGYAINLLLLGEGDERKCLEKYISNNNMDSYVSLSGFSTNPYRRMNESDIFVCSSRAEGFSLVIAEAMALGIPIVSTDCSGPNELLQKGRCGLLVENSEEGLYVGLKEALTNIGQMERYINIGQARIQEFLPYNIIKEIESLLDSIK